MTEPAAPRIPTEIDRIAEDWVRTEIELDPSLRVEYGTPGDQSEYADYSPAGFERRREAIGGVLRELSAAVAVDEVDEVTVLELRRDLGLQLEELDAGLGYRDLNNIASPVQELRMVFDLMPQQHTGDLEDIARRLARLPEALAGYTVTLREGIRRGSVPARRQVAEVITQANDYAKPGGFFDELAGGGALVAPTLAGELHHGAGQAREAYAELARFLREELAPVSREQDAVGREEYALRSRGFLGATIDLDETYEWGVDELTRMRAEQEAIAREIRPGATVAEAIAQLESDPARKLHGTEALQQWMQTTSDQAIEQLGASHFDIPEPLRRLECRIAPTQEGGIYYTGPSEDFSRPGRMWWSVVPGVTEFDTWRERTTVYHEGVPGHHLQVGHAVHIKDRLNSWRRKNWTSGHGEGWALYAERLMADLGYLDDPADRLGMLDGQRMRAARVVLDLGVHLGKRVPDGEQRWHYEYALDFLRQHVHLPDGFVRFEVHRYLGWPGQAPAYKVGQRIWEQLRAQAERREPAGFDLRAWHTRALDLGGVGLDTLRAVLGSA